jgi:cytochrome c553
VFRDRKRGGTPYHHIMQRVATQLSDDDIRDVAAYLASLPAPGGR